MFCNTRFSQEVQETVSAPEPSFAMDFWPSHLWSALMKESTSARLWTHMANIQLEEFFMFKVHVASRIISWFTRSRSSEWEVSAFISFDVSGTNQANGLPHVQVSPPSVEIHEGETLRLYCRAVGSPTPGLKWKKRGGSLPPQVRNSVLLLFYLSCNTITFSVVIHHYFILYTLKERCYKNSDAKEHFLVPQRTLSFFILKSKETFPQPIVFCETKRFFWC